MHFMLTWADTIDGMNRSIAGFIRWGLLANALLITFNAIMRKFFSIAYPSAFDRQWHFFAAVVLLTAAYALQRNEHVRIDILAGRLGARGLAWLDLLGTVLVLIPVCALMVWAGSRGFLEALAGGESRAARDSTSNLPAWIMKGFIPLRFILLGLQGASEAVKCVAHLRGVRERRFDQALGRDGSA